VPLADAGPLLVAVLPFEHAGPEDQALFADGLTDAVAAKLAGLPGLAVIDRRSAAQYRATTKPAKQIGTELGVPYLLEGVVRWARDAGGAWRAQVTPTLVDARTGTTRWTGTPAVVTPSDPFTAQATIATDVARALAVELRPADEAALARRTTESPEAFAAYQRGLAIQEAIFRELPSLYQEERAMAEFEQAVALDSTFADAWGWLALSHLWAAWMTPGDQPRQERMRAALARARAQAPEHPLVLLAAARVRWQFDDDTVGVTSLVHRALTAAPNDAMVLSLASGWHWNRRPDSAYVLLRRAATLDPRSAPVLRDVGSLAALLRRWDDARGYADALIALDSTYEWGWEIRTIVERFRGDSLALRRELARGLAHVPRPSGLLLGAMAYAGEPYGRRFAALSARELGVTTLVDSVWNYYDNKADVFSRLGDEARARVYYDSIRTALTGRALDGPGEFLLHAIRALAEAAVGDTATARRSLARSATRAGPDADGDDLGLLYMRAATHARLGESERAVRYLERLLAYPAGGFTARALAAEAKFRPLHGTPAFERFLRAHPE
jgi:TolB-like protein